MLVHLLLPVTSVGLPRRTRRSLFDTALLPGRRAPSVLNGKSECQLRLNGLLQAKSKAENDTLIVESRLTLCQVRLNSSQVRNSIV